MDEKTLRNRITRDPEIFGGKPILRGMRISVETVERMMQKILSEHSADLEARAVITVSTSRVRISRSRAQ